jgi:hypothetical protein
MATPLPLVNAKERNTMEPEKDFPQSLPWLTRIRLRFTSDIDTKWGDTILLACFFSTGMVDAIAFNTWNCFVGMQTGWLTMCAPISTEGKTDHSLQETPFSQASESVTFLTASRAIPGPSRWWPSLHSASEPCSSPDGIVLSDL